jgi:HEAT repeat protein
MGSEAVPHLVMALNDEDKEVRWEAANALRKVGTPGDIDALAALLAPENKDGTRELAAYVLGGLGPGAISHLISALDDPIVEVQRAAISALGNLGDPVAVDALARFVRPDQPVELQYPAAEALSKLGLGAIPHLERVVQLLREGAYQWPQDSKNTAEGWLRELQRQQKAALGR